MPYQATSTLIATVSVCCEACGNLYTYEHVFKAYGRSSNEYQARSLAEQNRERVLEWQNKRIAEGNISSVSDYKPCPKCGYVQTWMIEPVRRRRGWQWGLGVAFVAFILMIPVSLVLNTLLSASSGIVSTAAPLMVCSLYGLPIIILLVVRAIARAASHPNKNHPAVTKTNKPSVEFHKKIEIGAKYTM